MILGISIYLFANYIAGQVAQGKAQISEAQGKVDQTRGLTSLSPYTKDVGGMVADSAQEKIDAGEEEVIKYERLVDWLHAGGIVVGILGVGLIGISFIHKNKKHR